MADIFSSRYMLQAMEQMLEPTTALLDSYFDDVETFDTEVVEVDIVKGKRTIAPYVRPDEPGKLMQDLLVSKRTYTPPYMKPKKVTKAGQLLKRMAGDNPYVTRSPMQRAAAKLAKDIVEMWTTVIRRLEQQASQAVTTGQLTIIGDSINETIDFVMLPSHLVVLTGTDLWSDQTNSDPIADIRNWKINLCLKDSGLNPDRGYLGEDAYNAFVNHPKVQSILDKNNLIIGQINKVQVAPGIEFVGVIEHVQWYVYSSWYVDPVSGLEVPYIPANKVVLGSTMAQNKKLYAAIQNDDSFIPVEYFPSSWKKPSTGRRYVQVESSCMAGLNQPDAFVCAEVV